MLLATAITVAIVAASQLITQRIERLLNNQANELLAADLVIVSSNELTKNYQQEAISRGVISCDNNQPTHRYFYR